MIRPVVERAAAPRRTRLLPVTVARRSLLGSLWLIVPLVLLATLALGTFGAGDQRTLVTFLINVTLVVGLGSFAGNAGVMSFGHAGFVALGAYLGGILVMDPVQKASALPDLPAFLADPHLAVPAALLVTALVVGALSLLPGLIVSRMAPSAAVLGTFALLVIVNDVLTGARTITRGNQTFFGVPPVASIITCLTVAGVAIVVARLYRDSALGLRLRAAREDPLAAAAVGIVVSRQRLVGWVLSAMLCAAGGLLLGAFIGAFSPKTFYLTLTFQLLAMLLVGGWTTVSGAVLGAGVITLLSTVLSDLAAGPGPLPQFLSLTEVGISVSILVVLYFRRDGLMGRLEVDEHWRAWRRRRREAAAPSVVTDDAAAPAAPGDPAPAATPSTVTPPATTPDAPRERRDGEDLVVRGLTKSFDGLQVLRGAELTVRTGEILGVIGPNGSGKTTLVNAITGVIRPESGSVELGGRELAGRPAWQISRAGIARTFQNIRLFSTLSVRQNVQVATTAHGGGTLTEDAADGLLAMVGLDDLAEREAQSLPYGAQRRLEIARALATEPRLLLLDEPAAGLNDVESERLLTMLRTITTGDGVGVLIIDHDLGLMMRLCDRIVVLDQGAVIADGSPDEIRANPEVLRAYMGAKSAMALNEGRSE